MRRNPREKVAIRAICSRCGPTRNRLTCIAAVFSAMDKALLLAERDAQYLDSGFRRNDGLKAGASPGYFADEICSLRFDRLSANGKTGSGRTARRAQREWQDRLSGNGKTGSARMARQAQGERQTGSARTARQAQGERQDGLSANGKTGSAGTARQAQRERQDRHRANGKTG